MFHSYYDYFYLGIVFEFGRIYLFHTVAWIGNRVCVPSVRDIYIYHILVFLLLASQRK